VSRSGYIDDCWDGDNWSAIMYCGAVTSAFRGKRGQAFLKEILAALDAMPEKRLVGDSLEDQEGAVCTLGAVGKARNMVMSQIDPEDYHTVAGKFGIAEAMAREIVYMNDEASWGNETPEQRWSRMRIWIAGNIRD
jgi:hypothetical protein